MESAMRIGVPVEIKAQEYRVGMTPAGVGELTALGHEVCVQSKAGEGAGFSDSDYRSAGAQIAADARATFAAAELIIKVKEPQPSEYPLLHAGHTLFTYLHLAADPQQAQALINIGLTAVAYETVTAADGSLPLLTPMSEVAGRMSVQVAATALQKANGGRGILLGGVSGVESGKVIILGGGVAGTNAAAMAIGLHADVTIVDSSIKRLRELSAQFGSAVKTSYATTAAIEALISTADVVIGAVLVPGAAAPKLITRNMLQRMQPGAVLVDIAIDQGGCFETSHATTHADPTYVVDGIVHYCVANIPGAVPRTATMALTHATLPYIKSLAQQGIVQALATDPHLMNGVNIQRGKIVHAAVAKSLQRSGVITA
jgi:alanine dehydrogenase